MPRKKKLGVGAKCTIKNKYLHPKKVISEKYPNQTAQSQLEDCVCIKKGTKEIRRKDAEVAFFRHDDLPNAEIYCIPRWAKVVEEGPAEHFFEKDGEQNNQGDGAAAANTEEDNEGEEIPNEVLRARNHAEDIARVQAMGFMVDNDNEPAPENVPELQEEEEATNEQQTWGWSGADQRKLFGAEDLPPKMNGLRGVALETITFTGMFLTFFPRIFLEHTIMKETNKKLEKDLTFGEFLIFIGIWLVMSYSSPGNLDRREFWAKTKPSREGGAPFRLNDLMSGRRFEEICGALSYTSLDPPAFKDKFWEIREMVQAWNENMKAAFTSAWINCLDESMSIWTNKWTYPGYVFCPRKPHPFGNEYHTIACGICGILFAIEMVEGNDRPRELPAAPANKKTIHLLLSLCKNLYGTGKIVILDSGFCVLEGLIELRKKGVFGGALIKKRRYWPKHVPGDMIDAHFTEKEVGSTDSLKGKLDGVHYDIFCMKEPEYVMKIMSTYGGLLENDHQKESLRKYKVDGEDREKRFKYTIPFSNHFDYRHMVDDHNSIRHQVPSLEQTWRTHRWANRVFSFLLAVTEVNCYLAFRFFVWSDEGKIDFMTFRSRLAWSLIMNDFRDTSDPSTTRSKRKVVTETHELKSAPPHAKRWLGTKWDLTCSQDYQQHRCKWPGCKKK